MSTENLKVVISGDASGIDKASTRAKASIDKISQSAAEWDKRARELNLQLRYGATATREFGNTAASVARKVQVTTQEVVRSEEAMRAMSKSSSSATNSLFALGGIVQDAPYGFRAIANNITFFTQEMSYSAKAAGGFGKALGAMGSALIGPAGIILGISAVTSIITSMTAKYGSLDAAIRALTGGPLSDEEVAHQNITKALSDSNTEMDSSIAKLLHVYTAVDSASKGYGSAKEAVSLYNKQLGGTLGNVNSLTEAQNKLGKSFDDYIQNVTLATVQSKLLASAADIITKNIAEQAKTNNEAATTWQKVGNFITLLVKGGPGQGQNIFKSFASDMHKMNAESGQASKNLSQLTAQNSVAKTIQQVEDLTKKIKKLGGTGGGTGGGMKTISDVIATLTANFLAADSKALIFGASIEQVGAMKMKSLSDAMNSLAKISTPAAIAEAKKLGAEYDQIAKSSFLPTLTGGRAGVNATAGITGNPGVPTYINPNVAPGLNTNSQEVATAQQKLLNDQFRQSMQLGRQMESVFSGVFQAIEQGGNPFQAMIQAVEHLIAKLAEAAAVAAVLSLLSGGTANAAAGGISFLTAFKGLTHFAGGGFIPSPQLAVVGDAPGGEWVLNQKQISAILNGTGGGRNVNVTGRIEAEGSTLAVVINNANKKTGRRN